MLFVFYLFLLGNFYSQNKPLDYFYTTDSVPNGFVLFGSYPNPFSNAFVATFGIPDTSQIEIKLNNDNLKLIICTVNFQDFPPGYYRLQWNMIDSIGRQAETGKYFLEISIKSKSALKNIESYYFGRTFLGFYIKH